jgi:predicted component of type VI protein secretion system
MTYILSQVKEITPAEMLQMQKDLEEVKSMLGGKNLVVELVQNMLDEAEEIL